MVSIELFEILLDKAASSLPAKLYEKLNLGVGLVESAKINTGTASGAAAYILGEYHVRRHLGNGIVLYYGSFSRLYPEMDNEDEAYERILQVLKHELTHHLEHLAGENDLAEEDARRLKEM